MTCEQHVQLAVGAEFVRIEQEYESLLNLSRASLQELLNPPDFRLDVYCKEFSPHPRSEELKKIVQSFAELYGVWLDNAKHHITCALFLYPTANPERILTIMKNLVIDFYLNDIMGRDRFAHLSSQEQDEGRKLIYRMTNADDRIVVPSDLHSILDANAEALKEFRESSPSGWFSQFLSLYNHHISITHRDNRPETQDRILSIEEYIDMRCHFAGMHHIVIWVEYSEGTFLEWDQLEGLSLSGILKRLHYLAAAFGALSNDLFSFEKEVIDNSSYSNLIMVIVLNNPGIPLSEAIAQASNVVREFLSEYLILLESINCRIIDLEPLHEEVIRRLQTHLNGLKRCVQACWMWQVYTKRYKRTRSLWQETALSD
jgi:terpene synthase-like protein